eukprot:196988-Pleurochrysis_carterae.AAC.1
MVRVRGGHCQSGAQARVGALTPEERVCHGTPGREGESKGRLQEGLSIAGPNRPTPRICVRRKGVHSRCHVRAQLRCGQRGREVVRRASQHGQVRALGDKPVFAATGATATATLFVVATRNREAQVSSAWRKRQGVEERSTHGRGACTFSGTQINPQPAIHGQSEVAEGA